MKKLVLLDVDGVLSIERPVSPEMWDIPEVSYARNYSGTSKINIPNKHNTFRTHTYRPDIITSINYLVDNYNVEIKFLTNWGEAAKTVFSEYVGLKNIISMDFDAKDLGTPKISDSTNPIHWYKAQALLREVKDRGRDAIMVDDLINLELAKELSKELPINSGWLKINPMIGLSKDWINAIRTWSEGGPPIRKHTA